MASRRNKKLRRYRQWAPDSLYDYLLMETKKPYVTMEEGREIRKAQGKLFVRMFSDFCANEKAAA